MNINKLKGQISVFVIIAVILVLGAVILLSYKSDSISLFTQDKSSYKIKQFVQGCLEEETNAAVNEMGLKGGWLYHTPIKYAKVDENKYLVKNSRGFDYFGVEMPYWYYYDESTQSFELDYPEYDTENKYSMKNQIKRYLDENLEKNCIKSFSSFQDQYLIKYEPREVNTKVIFDGDNIEVMLNLPLEIIEINSNSSEYIDTFSIIEENKLKIPYFLARDIVTAESQNSFIEYRMLNFISAYQSTKDKSLLPPFYDFKMTFDKKPWKVADVEILTKQVISSNIGVIQFIQTDFVEREIPSELKSSEFARNFYANYNKDYIEDYSLVKEDEPSIYRQFQDYKVKPTYEVFYPTYFSLAPSFADQVLFPKSESVFSLIPFFFTEYVAVYEITTPVIFEITPSNENDNFVFNFAVETNINHNTALRENYDLDIDLSEFNDNSNKNLICEPSQFISKPIYLNITDPVDFGNRKDSRDPIKGVSDAYVSFTCKKLATCYVGQTEMNGEFISKNITSLAFRLPINCDPGTLEIYKFGHKKIVIENVNPSLDTEINLGEYNMYSKKKFLLNTKLLNPSNSRFSTGNSFEEKDTGFLILENLEDSDIVEVVEINYENQYNLSLELMPGNYSIKGFVIHNDKVFIPSEEICYETGLFSDKECQSIPELNMDSWVRGGLEVERFEVKLNDLLQSESITISLVDFGIPSSYSELNAMSAYMSDIKSTSTKFEPEFD